MGTRYNERGLILVSCKGCGRPVAGRGRNKEYCLTCEWERHKEGMRRRYKEKTKAVGGKL